MTEDWEGHHAQSSRWRRAAPAVVLLVVGVALVVQGLPGDEQDAGGLVVDGEDDGEPEEQEADDEDDGEADSEATDEEPDEEPDEPQQVPGTGTPSDGEAELETSDRLPDGEGVLYALGRDTVVRLDLASGERAERELPELTLQGSPAGYLASVGEHLVIVPAQSAALVLPGDLSGEPMELDASDASDPWVSTALAGPGDDAITLLTRRAGGTRLQAINVESGDELAARDLPNTAQVVHVTGRDAIVGMAGEIFRHDIDTGEGERLAVGTPVAANDDLVVYMQCGADLDCSLMSQRYGEDQGERISDASSVYSSPWTQQLSPDSRWLQVIGAFTDTDNPTPESVAIELATGERHEPPQGSLGPMSVPWSNAWTPDGAWLLEASGSTVVAWRPDDDEAVRLEPDIGSIEALVTAP